MPIQLKNRGNTPIYSGANITVRSVTKQSNNMIILGGRFTSWYGTTVGCIVRLNADDSRDTTFSTNVGTAAGTSGINVVATQSDDKILVGGGFTTWNGTTVGCIVRLNSDGTRDTTFTTNNGTGASAYVKDIAIQPDGKIIIVGNFATWNGTTVNCIVRLNPDGTRDTAFTTNTGTGSFNQMYGTAIPCHTIAIQPDGKILIGGQFDTWNGASVVGIVRLNQDGTRDTAFSTNVGTGPILSGPTWLTAIYKITLQTNGSILAVGQYTEWSGTTVNGIVRLNSNGTRDTTFTTNTGTASGGATVYGATVQSDNKILLTGYFSTWNGATVNYIVRLNSDGTRDTAFTTNTGGALNNGSNSSPFIDSENRIIIPNESTYWNGQYRPYIVRIASNGQEVPSATPYVKVGGVWKPAKAIYNKVANTWYSSFLQGGIRDITFTTNNGTGANLGLYSVALQNDKKIVAAGSLSTWNGATVGRIVRLNSDGTRDTAFTTNTGTGADGDIYSVAIMPDGKIVVGGAFFNWNAVNVTRIVRLNSDGTRDVTFTTNTGNGANGGDIWTSVAQIDGKVILGGNFTQWANGTTVNCIVRLNSDGTRDTAFTTNTGTGSNSYVFALTLDTSQRILVGGFFTTWNGATVGRIVKLNSDGTRDTAFTTNTGTGANGGVRAITTQPDGKIVVGGSFTTWNGITVNRIVRLNSDGTRDTAFTTNTGTGANGDVSSIKAQYDGKIIIGGNFTTWNGVTVGRIVRLNADGTRDTAFTTNTGAGANGVVYSLALQDNGKFIIGSYSMTSWDNTSVGYLARIGSEQAI